MLEALGKAHDSTTFPCIVFQTACKISAQTEIEFKDTFQVKWNILKNQFSFQYFSKHSVGICEVTQYNIIWKWISNMSRILSQRSNNKYFLLKYRLLNYDNISKIIITFEQ